MDKVVGGTRNMGKDIELLRKKAEQGDVDAQYELGLILMDPDGNDPEALKWVRRASDQGHSGGQYLMGLCYSFGKGLPKNYAEAARWYRMAAEQGDIDAQKMLGDCYYYGRGLTKNYTEAVRWYRMAAEQGEENAQKMLGDCYYYGRGVQKNISEAINWYHKASEQGNKEAQQNLEKCSAEGFCRKCGKKLENDWTVCPQCNTCSKCGEQIENDWSVCPACNSKVIKVKKQEVCVKCGTVLKSNWISCPKCQTPIANRKTPTFITKNGQHENCPDCGERLKGTANGEELKNWCEKCGYAEIYPFTEAIEVSGLPNVNCPKCQHKLSRSNKIPTGHENSRGMELFRQDKICPKCGYLEFLVAPEELFEVLERHNL